ncbi:MAG TPA: efflux RND transporter periplasmic adaptor subunit [Vicinamibacteria bacterium]|nr:efflux RND transporter periplasmic adaptor subunit [Vicinamibacteria bacterium]
MRNATSILAAALGGTVLLAGCGAGAAAPQAKARSTGLTLPPDQLARVKVEPVALTSFRRTVETTGAVAFDADRATQVLAPISGPVSRLLVSVGAQVKTGQPLATVASPDFATAVSAYRKAEATARNARRISDLDKELFKNNAIARRDMEQADTDVVSMEADRDAALLQLRALGLDDAALDDIRQGRAVTTGGNIRSPISGTVVEKLITPGQLLQAGTTSSFTVADLSTVWVMANIFESSLPFVAIGDAAEIRTGASPEAFPGTVNYIAAFVDPNTRAIAVRIVAANPKGVLKKDLYVNVSIHSKRDASGILVPVSAVLRDDENLPFVYVQNADGTFVRRRVTLGAQVGERYEIREGLQPPERVVADGGLFMQFAESQ